MNKRWERPRNLLLTQIYRDIQRVSGWYSPEAFVASVLDGASQVEIKKFNEQLEDLLQRTVIGEVSEASIDAAIEWDPFLHFLF